MATKLCSISYQGLDLQVVDAAEEAEFVLAHGAEALGRSSGPPLEKSLQEIEQILECCAYKGIPMIVANPDFVTVAASALCIMPGSVLCLLFILP